MRSRLLLIEDDRYLRDSLMNLLPQEQFQIVAVASVAEGRRVLEGEDVDLVLMDLGLPDGSGMELVAEFSPRYRNRIIILTGAASVETAVQAIKSGVFDFLEKPVNPERLLSTLQKAAELQHEFREYYDLRNECSAIPSIHKLIYQSEAMSRLMGMAQKMALSDGAVLITGETGTGKELQAQVIHACSRRKNKSFISVNCASIPENLAEAELFGYKKGAFTGADSEYPGKFRLAHKGSIFLDEIAELPLTVQGKLLRTLDSGEISPLKSTRPFQVDVRVIAATNKNLEDEVKIKNFREDLFYRIAELTLHIPPLRDRRDDIMPLVMHFLHISNIANRKKIHSVHPGARDLLLNYPWPGNIRELRNVINETSALMTGEEIHAQHLPSRIVNRNLAQNPHLAAPLPLREVEKNHIIYVLKQTGYDYQQAHQLLGISRATLYRKIQEYFIIKPDFKPGRRF